MTESAIRTLIVDDEPAARAAIRALLAHDPKSSWWARRKTEAPPFAPSSATGRSWCLLDIQMPGLDGFRVLQSLETPEQLSVVFVTAYDEYALQAFDVHAVDYLLKPFDDARFRLALTRAKQEVRQRRLGMVSDRLVSLLESLGRRAAESATPARSEGYLRRIAIKSGGRVSIVATRDIDWIEAEGDYMRLHLGKASHLVRETMGKMEAGLDPARFVRIHRSTIVNLERIKELQPFFKGEYVAVLHDGTELKLSRGIQGQAGSGAGPFVS